MELLPKVVKDQGAKNGGERVEITQINYSARGEIFTPVVTLIYSNNCRSIKCIVSFRAANKAHKNSIEPTYQIVDIFTTIDFKEGNHRILLDFSWFLEKAQAWLLGEVEQIVKNPAFKQG